VLPKEKSDTRLQAHWDFAKGLAELKLDGNTYEHDNIQQAKPEMGEGFVSVNFDISSWSFGPQYHPIQL
jgi:hypothetical protein